MNRTEPPTSQPQPNCGVVRPAPWAAPFVGRPADAANDPHVSPAGSVCTSALLNKARERLAAAESGQSSKYSRRRIAAVRNRLTWAAEPGTADRLQLICAAHVQVTTTERGAK